ncbi:MAG: ImmA/IrrE family metallo-endopeptidase [Clostridium sp.]
MSKHIFNLVKDLKSKHEICTANEVADFNSIDIFELKLPSETRGMLVKESNTTIFVINDSLSGNDLEAAKVHELGHHFLHPYVNCFRNKLGVNRREREADIFTGEFLIDDETLKEYSTFQEAAAALNLPIDVVKGKFESFKMRHPDYNYEEHIWL